MSNFNLLRFLTPNSGVAVSRLGADQSTTAALGQAVENFDTYGVRANGTNAATAAFTLDASLASPLTGLKLPSSVGAAPTAAGAVAWESTEKTVAFGDGTNTLKLGSILFNDQTLGGAAALVTVSSIPAGYAGLEMVIQTRATGAVTLSQLQIRFNGDTGANYDRNGVNGLGPGTVTDVEALADTSAIVGVIPGSPVTRAAMAGAFTITIPNYSGTTFEKSYVAVGGFVDSTSAQNSVRTTVGSWRSTAAISSLVLATNGTSFAAGTRVTTYLKC